MEMTEIVDPDLSTLDELTEQNILHRLKSRYDRDLIYTCVKDILIVINPCKQVDIYNTQTHNDYGSDNFDSTLQPHVFQVAARAYRRLCDSETNQVIIVSGESGAGKTESTKHMVSHIVHMCQKGNMDLDQKIVEINPLLETFGNAKTTMNPNSSRFAKYLELTFNAEGQDLAGAVVRDYMLEKSRVVHQSKDEGNFHVFYSLFAGCPTQKLQDLFLEKAPMDYRIMQSDMESLDDVGRYRAMYDSNMDTLNKIGVDTDILHVMLAAIINISEITFEEGKDGKADIVDPAPFEHAAILLELDREEFGISLTTSKRTIRGQEIVSYKTVNQANDSRDSLAKMLYERMFGWLVRQINQDLHPNRQSSVKDSLGNIGILDIAGFEKLRLNSLEQLCINLVNEKLQNFMNQRIFQIEMMIYKGEGIDLEGVNFENNDKTLEMFEERKVGILAILDEKSTFQQGNDGAFVMELKNKFKFNPLFIEVKSDLPQFLIQHFAAVVCYDANGFIEKNRDVLNPELTDCLKNSKDDLIKDLFTVKRGPTGTISVPQNNFRKSNRRGPQVMPRGRVELKPTPKGMSLAEQLGKSLRTKFGTVSPAQEGMTQIKYVEEHKTLVSYFRASLLDLIDKLNSAEPFYVRCLKPNMVLAPDSFDDTIVINQLHYNGITQIAKIRKMGFAVRVDFNTFVKKYKCLLRTYQKSESDVNTARAILLQLPADYHRDFRLGKTKVFMTHEVDLFLGKFLNIRKKAERRILLRLVPHMRSKIDAIIDRKRREEAERQRKIEEERKRVEEERKRVEEANKLRQSHAGLGATLGATLKKDDGENSLGKSQKTGLGTTLGRSVRFEETNIDYDVFPPDSEYTEEPQPGPSRDTGFTSQLGETIDRPDGPVRPPSPPTAIDPDRHDKGNTPEKKEDKESEKKENAKKFFWDVCQVIAREQRSKDVHENRSLQVIKVLTYFLLFCLLLWCAVAQKISLMMLASPQFERTENRTESEQDIHSVQAAGRHMLMTLAIMIPYGLTLLSNLFKWMFGNFPVPAPSTFGLFFVIELIHSAGLCTLCFLILPEVDTARGIMLMSGVAIAPSILYPLCSSRAKHDRTSATMKMIQFVAGLIFILIQCGYIPLLLLDKYANPESRVDNDSGEMALVIIAMICVSVSWWENFVDDHFCGPTPKGSGWHQFILGVKFDLQEGRPVVSVFMSMWKIALTILFSFVYKTYLPINEDNDKTDINDVTMSQIFKYWDTLELKDNAAILTLTLSSFVGYYVGYTACKLRLQKLSFNIPLLLSLPISVGIAVLDCTDYISLNAFTSEMLTCRKDSEADTDNYSDRWWHFLCGFAAWVSLYGIARYIFTPTIERLAKVERLFVNPFYCGILFEQHMILNRRRHNRKVLREVKEDRTYFRLSGYDSKINIEGIEEENRSDGKVKADSMNDVESDNYINPKFRDVPTIYACATMWHENKQEMVQLMKSIFRMDRDQCIRRQAEVLAGKPDKEYYEFEAHVFFDDCMEIDDNDEVIPNPFVRLLLSIMDEAASSVYEKHMTLKPPVKVFTPYGGQLVWTMPGDNFFFVHLKDKSKIRHKKRWSQVMYMYYLLGFRIVRMCQEAVTAALNENRLNDLGNWGDRIEQGAGNIGKSHIFQAFDEQVLKKANNTYLLALDGDVDFTPGAVRLLIDRMRKSEQVGAACGRIHPIGSGPVVWFQKFEYAIAHWFQKATEHVLGCVLCSPGCFSLFRGSALMDDNVMRKYTILPNEAHQHLMYDQGEDRWLCTLLLQQGYRVDYAAGSDAFTYAPEGFAEFFNQRRRWMPSTVANIVDLLADYKNTVLVNNNISMLYIFYQASLLLSTVIGPATILMMIAGANLVVFKVGLYYAYLIALLPAIIYFIFCFVLKTKHQILAAEILTAFYAFTMMIVLVGTIVTAAKESVWHPSVIFIAMLVFLFGFAAVLHPKEWTCVIYGALYFILIPTGFLLLTFYSLCNMHVISWGTREVPKRKTPEEIEKQKAAEEEKKKKKKEQGFFGRFFPSAPLKDIKELVGKITEAQGTKKVEEESASVKLLQEINEGIQKLSESKEDKRETIVDLSNADESESNADDNSHGSTKKTKGILKPSASQKGSLRRSAASRESAKVRIGDSIKVMNDDSVETIYDKLPPKKRDDMVNPAWADIDELKNAPSIPLMEQELNFWQEFIKKYLYPLHVDKEKQKQTSKELMGLRTDVALGMAMTNLLWIAINFMFQLNSPTKVSLKLSSGTEEDLIEEEQSSTEDEPADNIVSVDVLGLLFILFYVVILLIQFIGMLMHRWGTFLHLIAVTEINNPFKKRFRPGDSSNQGLDTKDAVKMVETIMAEPLPDYPDSDTDDSDEDDNITKQELMRIQTTGTRAPIGSSLGGGIGISTRLLDVSRRGDMSGKSFRNTLAQSTKLFREGLRATGQFSKAPNMEEMRAQMQHVYRQRKDSKYNDRALPLPPVQKRKRMNLNAGRIDLTELLKEKNHGRYFNENESQRRPLIPDRDEGDEVYDTIYGQQRPKGTVSRQFGKKLKLYASAVNASAVNRRPHSVHFTDSTDNREYRNDRTRLNGGANRPQSAGRDHQRRGHIIEEARL